MTDSHIEISSPADGVALVTMTRPDKKNALSISMRDQISDTFDDLAGNDEVRAVVLTGTGSTFSAGFDLSEFTAADQEIQKALWPSSDRFHHTVLRFPLPVVAAVNGPALAGGFDLATLCDIRICADAAVFGHPEQAWADVIYGPLHDLVGGAVARDLCFTGRKVDAAEALRIGLVSRIESIETLVDSAVATAGDIARAPREVLIRTKAKALARSTVTPNAATLTL